jgi:hypothetical protein
LSFDFRGIRIQSNDPLTQFVVEQQKALAKFLTSQQVAAVDSDNEDIYSDAQDMETAIKYHSELGSQYLFDFVKEAYPPDITDISCWIRGTNLGTYIKDLSYHNNVARINGDPTLVDGTIDLGLATHGTKSIAMWLNRPTSEFENLEWIQIPDSVDTQLASDSTGFSLFLRFRMHSVEEQGGLSATLYQKVDDSTPNNAVMVQVKDDGRIVVVIKKGGTVTAKETVLGVIQVDQVYEVHITFTVSGSVIHVYVDSVDKTLTTHTGTINWQETLTNHDTYLGRRGFGSIGGFANYDFYDVIMWLSRILNQTEVTRFFTNKWTIANIPFGKCIIANYWATSGGSEPPEEEAECSFSEDSFSATSFMICTVPSETTDASFMDISFSETSFMTD